MVVIPIPPSVAPGTNVQCCNSSCTIIEDRNDGYAAPAFINYRGNVDHPQQSTSTEVTDSQRQPSMITGDMPTLDEHQALEQVELATSDVDDDFLHMLHMLKSWHGADFPPSNIPYNKDLDGHIMQAMQQISANIRHLVRSWVQHVQAGQYMVDMIDLLEISCHPHVGYSLQPYTRGPPYPSQQSVIEMAIVQWLKKVSQCWVILQRSLICDWTTENQFMGLQSV
ncbi:hypothetical protein EDD17DRAFT_1516475 [Pisolithus thermaeus]|nr:hypothetical protein EDD17DRAFT_1516475 [Pisolithus thermaeus]